MRPFLFSTDDGTGAGGGGGGQTFTPSFDGALKPDGSFSEGWTAKAFGADYKGPLSTAKTFGDVNKMLNDSMAAARAKTDGMVRVPGDGAKPEELSAFLKAIGVPDDPKEYDFTKPEGIEDKDIDASRIDSWKARMKEAGVPKGAANKIISAYLADELDMTKTKSEALQKSLDEERAALAKAFPEIDKTVASVKALGNRAGVPESLKKAIAEGAFDPTNQQGFWGVAALESFAHFAKALGEDGGAGGGKAVDASTAKQLNAEAAKLHSEGKIAEARERARQAQEIYARGA